LINYTYYKIFLTLLICCSVLSLGVMVSVTADQTIISDNSEKGKEDIYLNWFYDHTSYNQSAMP
jgi:hypothetical protein